MLTGLFPLSGDPLHFGHIDIINRASQQCDRLVVAVLDNDMKAGSYTFSMAERVINTRRAIRLFIPPGECQIDVVGSTDLLVDVFLKEGCYTLFRGVRDDKDKAFETQQMALHEYILPGITARVRYIEADPKYAVVSSSAIKAMLLHGADVSTMCPLFIKSKLERRLMDQYIIGVTGGMGTGKTWVCTKLVEAFKALDIPAHHVNLDQAVRDALGEDSPGAARMREQIQTFAKVTIEAKDGVADLTAYKAKIASGEITDGDINQISDITEPHVMRHLRRMMRGKRGVVLVEWALLAENDLSHLCNHDVIMVDSPEQQEFLKDRGVDPAFADRLISKQWIASHKARAIQDRIDQDKCGIVLNYENVKGSEPTHLANILVSLFPGLERVQGCSGQGVRA